ncbi:thymidylate synthase [Vibrio phage phiKT1019]|nr:thymidylate synthase [Vibrio phage phiKT1019]
MIYTNFKELGLRVLNEGEYIHNKRTGKKCLTVINADMTYRNDLNAVPANTLRQSPFYLGVGELLGYWKGLMNAADFRALMTKSWDSNANKNEAWLNNPNRLGEDDMGIVYGGVGNHWPLMEFVNREARIKDDGTLDLRHSGEIDLLHRIYTDLSNGLDDRGEILNFWNPGMFDLGCLRPCMYSHHWSLVNENMYLNSTQRSADLGLGVSSNMIQVFLSNALMAQITGHKAKESYHKLVNVHLYEDQVDLFRGEMEREPLEAPKLWINPDIKTLEDVRTWVTPKDFALIDYKHHDKIVYPFTV